jgi:arylformamidase
MADSEDRRAQFDFEIEFANGGGIQGQGFRLDIDGDEISDQALAADLVADLRLLMVSETRILNKRIITERHKRREPAPVDDAVRGPATHIDLSHTIEDGMVTYRGLPAPVICDYYRHEDCRDRYAPGTGFQIGQMSFSSNTGTYLDSPYHRYPDGADISELALDRLSGLDAVTVDVSGGAERSISAAQLLPYDVGGKAVLVHTGWDRHWRTDAYFEGHPFLTADAAEHLVSEGAVLVGIDSLNIDDIEDPTRPVHTMLLAAGVPICEHLTGLGALPGHGFSFSAVPAKVRAIGTFPVRAHATIDPPAGRCGGATPGGS